MLESIYVGMTGLLGYSRGLRVIANNTANLNTPGFKSASLQFSDLFYTGGNLQGGVTSRQPQQLGFGLDTAGTTLDFKQGELRQTGGALDLAVDGQGLFVLRNPDGSIGYSRAGQFEFDASGVLVARGSGAQVMSLDAAGGYAPITLAGHAMDAGLPTSRISLAGNLSSTATSVAVGGVRVIDAAGGSHSMSLQFARVAQTPGAWTVSLLEDGVVVGSGTVAFAGGKPVPENAVVLLDYTPPGLGPMSLALDLSADVSSFASGADSTLTVRTQDGVAAGARTGASFDANGALVCSFANGRTQNGPRIALARFDTPDAVAATGGNRFSMVDESAWHFGVANAGAFGPVRSGVVEISNVDLSREFSDLVVMQRGYQASSQIVSTANEMLQQLFSLKSR